MGTVNRMAVGVGIAAGYVHATGQSEKVWGFIQSAATSGAVNALSITKKIATFTFPKLAFLALSAGLTEIEKRYPRIYRPRQLIDGIAFRSLVLSVSLPISIAHTMATVVVDLGAKRLPRLHDIGTIALRSFLEATVLGCSSPLAITGIIVLSVGARVVECRLDKAMKAHDRELKAQAKMARNRQKMARKRQLEEEARKLAKHEAALQEIRELYSKKVPPVDLYEKPKSEAERWREMLTEMLNSDVRVT